MSDGAWTELVTDGWSLNMNLGWLCSIHHPRISLASFARWNLHPGILQSDHPHVFMTQPTNSMESAVFVLNISSSCPMLACPSEFAHISCSTWTLHTGNCSNSSRLAPISLKFHYLCWFACCRALPCLFSFWLGHHQISWIMRNITDSDYLCYIHLG